MRLRVALAGVGNCASALVQGVNHPAGPGLLHPRIGRWGPGDLDFVAAFDVDRRKVGRPLAEAIFAAPNCCQVFHRDVEAPTLVRMGPVLDGVAEHMADYPEEQAFRVADAAPVDVAAVLRESGAQVLLCYLPVGAEAAARHYAEACLQAHVAMVNCVPVFLASDPAWGERFRRAGVPIVGDDVKSQVGATIVHRVLARLMESRGVHLQRTYQLNTGGNTDFLNMLERGRLASKKKSKTQSVQSQLAVALEPGQVHIGPSDYVPWQKDNKVAFIRLEGEGFGGAPISLEIRLSVQDSPNSAGVVIDAARCAGLALERGLAGPLEGPSAFAMKSPPREMSDAEALDLLEAFLLEAVPTVG